MLDLRRVRVFHAVATHGSFSTAADVLGYTQPAVSHHVTALEREIGQRLIQRSARPFVLTAAGKRLMAAADVALAEFDRAELDLVALRSGSLGRLALASVVTGLRSVVPDAVRAFRGRYPDIDLSLSEGQPTDLLARVRSGRLDVAIVVATHGAPAPDPRVFATRALIEQEIVLAVPLRHRLARRTSVRLAELENQRWVLPAEARWSEYRAEVDAMLASAGIVPAGTIETTDDVAGARLVAAEEGIGLAPALASLPVPGVVMLPLRPPVTRRLLAVSIAGPAAAPLAAMLEELVAAGRADH